MSLVDDLGVWLAQGENHAEWTRLREALSLTDGFAVFLVVVADALTEEIVGCLLEAEAQTLARETVEASALDAGADSAVRRFSRVDAGERVLLHLATTQASNTDIEALERCFAQLNGRRDQLAARVGGPIVVSLRPDALRLLLDVAPDLYSVHSSQFHFAPVLEPCEAPPWLMLPFEAAGVLGVDPMFGPAERSGMPTFVEDPPELTEPLLGRELELGLIDNRMLAGARALRLVGDPGVGRTALARAILARTRERWAHVTWIAARVIANEYEALHAIVADLAEAPELPPVAAIDLEQRYRELTAQRPVLIVMDNLHEAIELPAPAPGSLLIEVKDDRQPKSPDDIEVRPLSATHQGELWATFSSRPVPARLSNMTYGSPIGVKLLARCAELGVDYESARPSARFGSWNLDAVWFLIAASRQEGERAAHAVTEALYYAPKIPLAALGVDASGLRGLREAALVRVEGDFAVSSEDAIVWPVQRYTPLISRIYNKLACAERPLDLSEFERRVLCVYSRDFEDGEFDEGDGTYRNLAHPTIVAASLGVLTPPLRPSFFDRLSDQPNGPYYAILFALQAFTPDRLRSRIEALAQSQVPDPEQHSHVRLLAELRPPNDSFAGARSALRDWERHGGADTLSAEARAELRRELGMHDGLLALPTEPHVSLVRTLRTLHGSSDAATAQALRRATSQDWGTYTTAIQHLAWSALAWLSIQQSRRAEAREALAQAETTARAWATPFALLRIRLLALEYAIASGDRLPDAALFDAVYERTEQLFGQLDTVTTTLLARGVEIFASTARPDRAQELADECWRRLQYADALTEQSLTTLAGHYAKQGLASRVEAIEARWRQSFPERDWPISG